MFVPLQSALSASLLSQACLGLPPPTRTLVRLSARMLAGSAEGDGALDGIATDAWLRDGLRFGCSACGNCCSGSPGQIYFKAEEAEAMAAKLGLETDDFYRDCVKRVVPEGGGRGGPFLYTLKEKAAPEGKGRDCVLLDRSTGRGLCSVYEARPSQCRSFPFWAGNVESPAAWAEAKAEAPCPGMDDGTLVPAAEIMRLALQDLADEKLMFDQAIAGSSKVEEAWNRANL